MAGLAPAANLSEHILMCGHAQKRAHSTSRWKSRFIVLSPSHLHWFKRQRGDVTLFGSELGSVELKAVSSASKVTNSEGGGGGWYYFTVEAIEEAGYATTPFLRNFRMEKKVRVRRAAPFPLNPFPSNNPKFLGGQGRLDQGHQPGHEGGQTYFHHFNPTLLPSYGNENQVLYSVDLL